MRGILDITPTYHLYFFYARSPSPIQPLGARHDASGAAAIEDVTRTAGQDSLQRDLANLQWRSPADSRRVSTNLGRGAANPVSLIDGPGRARGGDRARRRGTAVLAAPAGPEPPGRRRARLTLAAGRHREHAAGSAGRVGGAITSGAVSSRPRPAALLTYPNRMIDATSLGR